MKIYKYNKSINNSILSLNEIKTNDNNNNNNNYTNTSLINLNYNLLDLNLNDSEQLQKNKINNIDVENNLKEKEKNNKFHNAKYILETGKFFGDYNIVYQNKRSSIAKAIEDTICIGIPFDKFEFYFSDSILRKERERNLFLKEKLNIKKNEK